MSRLSWFPFYVDDYLGGTAMFSAEDTGKYLLCLLAQWGSGELRAIPSSGEGLAILCRGDGPSQRVLKKFEVVEIEGELYLRNKRLSDEWLKAHKEHTSKSLARKHGRVLQDTTQDTTQESRTQPQPQPQPERTTTPTAKRIPPAAASPEGSDPGWQTQAADDWIAEYGGSPPKQFFGAVKPMVRKHGWERVRPVLRFFLAETEIEFLNMAKFSGGFGQWESRMNGHAKSRASPKARQQEAGFAAFMRGGNVDAGQLGPGPGFVAGELATAGREPGSTGASGPDVPGRTRASDG